MFCREATDRDVLDRPRGRIIEPGGAIVFVEAAGQGIVGTCALQKAGDTGFELTNMGERGPVRGMKAGAFLRTAVIDPAPIRSVC